MQNRNVLGFAARVSAAGLFALSLQTGEAQARGAFKEITAPGTCTSPTTTATAVLRKLNNVWMFALQVVGPQSVGEWSVDWTKNNVFVATTQASYAPPGGWAAFGLSTAPGDNGLVTFRADGKSLTGEVCSAQISIKL